MTTFLPKEVQDGLDKAKRDSQRKAVRFHIQAENQRFPVLRVWKTGFALPADQSPRLRGYVDLFQGQTHVSSCLIVASSQERDEVVFEYKRATPASNGPAVDFERAAFQPAGLIEHQG